MKNERGGITVFLSIVLAVLMGFDFCLADCTKISCQALNLKYKTEMGLQSLMADYDFYLRDNYCLYGLTKTEDEYLKNQLYEYTDFYMPALGSDNIFFMVSQYSIGDLGVEKDKFLNDKSEFSKEINELMKIRAGENVLEKALDFLKDMKSGSEANYVFLECKKAGEIIAQAEECYVNLRRKVKGAFEGDRECVEGFEESVFKNMVSVLSESVNYFAETDAVASMAEALYSYVTFYGDINGFAIEEGKKLRDLGKTAEEIAVKLDKLKEDPEAEKYRRTIEDTVLPLKEISRRIKNTEVIYGLSSNLSEFDKCRGKINSILTETRNAKTEERKYSVGVLKEILSDMSLPLQLYFRMEETLNDVSDEKINITDKSTELAGMLFDDNGSPVIDSAIYESLPSVSAAASKYKDMMLPSFLGGNLEGGGLISEKEVEKQNGHSISDTVLLDEYIMTYLKNAHDFKITRYNYLGCEAEYIIAGNSSGDENIKEVRNRILGIRYLFNMAYFLSDSEKTDFAKKVGEAMAAAISRGAGGPLYTAAIISAWVLGESALDVSTVTKGGKVPLIKTKETWKLDLVTGDNASESGAEASTEKGLGYTDYLRILLLLENYDKKLLRIQDIIELNITKYSGIRYRLSDVCTSLTCNITYRIDLFSGKKKYEYKMSSKKSYFQ